MSPESYSVAQPQSITAHRALFVLVGLGLLALHLIGASTNPLDAPVLSALVILVLGVPHGAFDVALWQSDQRAANSQDLAIMLVKYISLAALFFGLWLIVPELALPVFLGISIYHFSGDWSKDLDLAPRLIATSAMIAAPAGLFREEVVEIFSWLAPEDTARLLGMIMAALSVPLLQASVVVIALLAIHRTWVAAELAVVLSLAWLMPPLLFFLVYFCGLHSVRHMLETHQQLRCRTVGEFVFAAWPYAPLAIFGTLLGAVTLSSLPLGPAMLGTVFMALGSLTVPHIIVVEASGRHAAP
ncbi:MAG: Brp/Blh family beta-carotene 15,15'-dioxygenase [Pseudomonadota bacterium]